MYLEKQIERIKLGRQWCYGNTIEEIREQEQVFHIELPAAYKEFLAICGKEPNHLFCGFNIKTAHWNYINECGRKSYRNALNENCPKDIFFIMEHHGYSYYYFHLNSGGNPDIWLLIHGDKVVNKPVGKLSDVLDKEIERLERMNGL